MDTTQNNPGELVEALQTRVAQLEEELTTTRQNARDTLEQFQNTTQQRETDIRNRFSEIVQTERKQRAREERKREADRQALKEALGYLHADKPPLDVEDARVTAILERAFRLAILLGYRSEARLIADAIGQGDKFDKANEEPEPDNDERKLALIETLETQTYAVHPLDPRLEPIWREAIRSAQRAGMCAEFETVAERVGIPTDYQFRYSGALEISVSGTVTHYVEGYATREEIRDGVGNYMDEFDLADHIHELDWEIESEEIEFEDD